MGEEAVGKPESYFWWIKLMLSGAKNITFELIVLKCWFLLDLLIYATWIPASAEGLVSCLRRAAILLNPKAN